MRREIPGLQQKAQYKDEIPEGFFLVRVERCFYRYHPQKPFYALRFAILQPEEFAGETVPGRLYCTPKALWKLRWFLCDFGYDAELFGRDVVDEKAILGLRGIIKVSHTTINGRSFLNLDSFASADKWEELSASTVGSRES